MAAYSSRDFSRDQMASLLDLISSNADARWPDGTYLLNSDVAWRLPGSRGDLRVWYGASGIEGYAWFDLITPSILDVRHGASNPGLADEMLDWLEERRRSIKPMVPWLLGLESMEQWETALDEGLPTREGDERVHLVECRDSDLDGIRWLESRGYERTEHFGFFLTRDLDAPLPEKKLPPGWQIREARPDEVEQRVQIHRASWHRSSYTREQYEAVRAIDIFDPELDLVAVSPAGEFASYCIGWVDHALSVGSFEPVGTAVKWRRKGLGQAVQLEGLRRMQEKGMRRAKIGTASFNDRAFGLYSSCGFKLSDRLRTYRKTLD